MKKVISILTAMLLVIALLPTGVFADSEPANWINDADTSWYDESKSEFNISTPRQLAGVASLVNGGKTLEGKTINLEADIDLNPGITFTKDGAPSGTAPKEWLPIGVWEGKDKNYWFEGTFNGNGHTVSGVYCNNEGIDSQALFGRSKGTIKNIGVINSYIRGNDFCGGICGDNSNCTITNCYNTGSVSGIDYVGGVCGNNNNNKIENSYNTGSVSGNSGVGGVCGNITNGTIENCYNTGSVSGTDTVGGVSGCNNSKIANCYNTGSVSGTDYVGGVCGLNYATIANCYNTDSVSGTSDVGGICGNNSGSLIENCYYSTNTTCSPENAIGTNNEVNSTHNVEGKLSTEMKSENFAEILGYLFKYDSAQNSGYPIFDLNKTINNKEDLITFRDVVNKGESCEGLTINLTTDINLNPGITINKDGAESGTPEEWTTIGTEDNYFFGTFNGNNHTISGVYINQPDKDYQGFFGICAVGEIKNLGIINSYIKGKYYVGGVCGYNNYYATIENCYNTGSVSGTSYVGGVCGWNHGIIKSSYNTGCISGSSFVGGVCGKNDEGTIKNCYYRNDIDGIPENAVGNESDTETVVGLTLTQMQSDDFADKFSEDFRHTITFKNSDLNSKKYFGGIDEFTLPVLTKTGYTFGGWYDNAEFTGDKVTEISNKDTGDKTFYAKWTPNKYDVTLNTDNATSCDKLESYIYNTGATLPIPTKTGYTFDGWYDNENCSGDVITKISDTDIESKEFYAKWVCTVTFNTDGGNTIDSEIVDINSSITEPTVPKKNGYTFDGWYNGTTEFNFTTPITSDITLTAHWKINNYKVTFSDGVATQNIDYNNKVTEPTTTKTGYKFDGWYNGDDKFDFTTPITDDITLTAHWTAKKYNVNYKINNEDYESGDYTFGEGITTLPVPSFTGYTFLGWFSDEDCSLNVNSIGTDEYGDKTFYSTKTANKYDVTLHNNGATSCDKLTSYTYDTGATLPIPTKTGYTFDGWYDNAEFTGDAITKISDTDIENKEFYAKWERTKLNMLDGENQTWTQGSKDGLTFRSEADLSNFENVTINGTIIDENNYTKKSGSTIITLKPEYLETLSTGTYTIVINSITGAATTTFEVKEKAITSSGLSNTKSSNPKTGNNIPVSLIILSGFSLACFVFTKKKNK